MMEWLKFGRGNKPPYRVGLALSGGGARGFAHCGAIQALLDVGLKPDIVAGVSAGSVVAAMYASGMKPMEILDVFREASFSDFAEMCVPRDGLFRLDGFKAFLKKHIKYQRIEQLPLPTVICATDFDNGVRTAFERGQVHECVVASCSIPIVFKPVTIGGVRYVDGGVIRNLPAWAIRERCRFLIGINCSPLGAAPKKNNLMEVALRSYELMAKNNALVDMELCDMVIRTEGIAHYKVFNLKDIDRVFESGYNDTMAYLTSHGFSKK